MRTFFPDSERGSVLSLNGDGDYVDCGHHPILDLTDAMSVSCWVTVASLERSHYLVSKGRAISWNCWASQVAGNIGFRCIGLSSGERPDRATVKGTARIDDGLWHHIACVYDGKQIRIHIDGPWIRAHRRGARFSVLHHQSTLAATIVGRDRNGTDASMTCVCSTTP